MLCVFLRFVFSNKSKTPVQKNKCAYFSGPVLYRIYAWLGLIIIFLSAFSGAPIPLFPETYEADVYNPEAPSMTNTSRPVYRHRVHAQRPNLIGLTSGDMDLPPRGTYFSSSAYLKMPCRWGVIYPFSKSTVGWPFRLLMLVNQGRSVRSAHCHTDLYINPAPPFILLTCRLYLNLHSPTAYELYINTFIYPLCI